MKRALCLSWLFVLSVTLTGVRNWQTYTNTTHVYDFTSDGDVVYLATWGGMVGLDVIAQTEVMRYSKGNGLTSQDVRTVEWMPQFNELLIGTRDRGINRLKDGSFSVTINQSTGLLSDRVYAVRGRDSLLYTATSGGVNIFVYDESFPFPFLMHSFEEDSGLSDNETYDLAFTDSGYLLALHEQSIDYAHVDSILVESAWHTIQGNDLGFTSTTELTSMAVRGNRLVVGTVEGISLVPDFPDVQHHVKRNTQNGLDYNRVYPVFIDGTGDVWFGYGYWNRATQLFETVVDYQDIPDQIALVHWDGADGFTTWMQENGLTTPLLMRIGEVSGKLALATWGEGLFIHNTGGDWTQFKPVSPEANTVKCLAVDQEGFVWLASGSIDTEPTSRGTRGVSGYNPNTGEWRNYRSASSGLNSDNIYTIAVDSQNRKWFGAWYGNALYGWGWGISMLAGDNWTYFDNNNSGIINTTIGVLGYDNLGMTSYPTNMWAGSYGNGGGINVFDADDDVVQTFSLPLGADLQDATMIYFSQDRIFFGSAHRGLRIWDSNDVPTSQFDPEWETPAPYELSGVSGYCYVYGGAELETWFGTEWWFATSLGLFVLNEDGDWFKLGTTIKRHIWSNGSWAVHTRYFTDEEKLFGSTPTFPTAILADPFGRVWIGSEAAGICMYDSESERYTNYNTSDVPLLTNFVTALAYEPRSGNLFIGTTEGLNAVGIGASVKSGTELEDVKAWPNPFHPDKGEVFTIGNKGGEEPMPIGTFKCNIYDVSGMLVRTLEENLWFQFTWDGNNQSGKKCASGIYFWVAYDGQGRITKGKVALFR